MSISRMRESSQSINSNPSLVFRFVGDNATGSKAPYTNNVWNLKTLSQQRTATSDNIRLDTRDRYPDNAAGLQVSVNGIIIDTFTYDYSTKTVTLPQSIGTDDKVSFVL